VVDVSRWPRPVDGYQVRSGTVSAAVGVIRAKGVVNFRLIVSRPAASVPGVSA